MELKKGDWDNLEGNVLFYSKYIGETKESLLHNTPFSMVDHAGERIFLENGNYIIGYLTTDPVQFRENAKMPEEAINIFFKAFDEQEKKIGAKHVVKIYSYSTNGTSLEEFLEGVDEVIDLGNYSNAQNAISSIESGLQYYTNLFIDQFSNKIGFDLNKEYSGEPDTPLDKVPKEKRKQHIMENYIIPMYDELNVRDNPLKFKELKQRFIQASESLKFPNTAFTLCAEISGAQNHELVQLYVDKLIATNEEDFDEAQRLKNEIEKVKKLQTQKK